MPRIFGSKPYASRKYIDLIHEASSAWANWDPSHKIQPGDFGEIDHDTGRLEKKGNIYTHEHIMAIAAKYPPVLGETKAYKQVLSRKVKALDLDAGNLANVAGLAEASIKMQLEFVNSRGAALIMHEPRTSYVPQELLEEIARNYVQYLRRMVVVTDVSSCSSYALYLSGNSKESVSVAFLSTTTLPPSLATSAGGNVGAGWWSSAHSGMFEHSHNFSESFYPLYVTKTLKNNVRRESPDPNGNDPEVKYTFEISDEPWNPLDEDGKEVMYEEGSEEEDW